MLRILDTMTGRLALFRPSRDSEVKMYTCGPSIYLRPHIGNYRTFLFEDLLQRYLEYLGYEVTRLMTITDVEDKAISEAQKRHVSLKRLTLSNEMTFISEMRSLKMKIPMLVRASSTVDQAANLIKILLDRDFAYRFKYQGKCNIYFKPLKFEEFGKLSKIDMSKWPRKPRRFHKDTYPGTPWNRGDFILWHGCKKKDSVCWPTKIGLGRPAWNVQDAAIVTKHLGFEIDIACGGIDNLVRHHDYTKAVVEAISDRKFAKYWLHVFHLFVEGRKMSKSSGNVYYLEDITKKGYLPEHLRFFLLYGHFTKKLDFTFHKLGELRLKLNTFREFVMKLTETGSKKSTLEGKKFVKTISSVFERNMNNNLDVKKTFDELCMIITKLDVMRRRGELGLEEAQEAVSTLRRIDQVLQVVF